MIAPATQMMGMTSAAMMPVNDHPDSVLTW